MSSRTFRLDVMALDRPLFSGECVSLVAPGVEGSFGVLANHASMIAALGVGELKIVEPSGTVRSLAIPGGFFEVSNNVAVVLTEGGEWSEEIDLPRAENAYQRAQARLASLLAGIDRPRARLALKKASVRIKVSRARGSP